MQAYMKSEMPFLGIQAPALRRVCRDVFAAHPLSSRNELEELVLDMWRRAEFREERYAVLALLARYPQWVSLPLLERLIVEGAWWDYVDTLAHRAGDLLRRDPSVAGGLRAWSRNPNLWKRRASIICQLGFKERTDLELLYACIEPNLTDREFFVRKAIGWALRDYAWHDPREVERYVREHADRLSALSKREATKNFVKLLEHEENR